MITHHDLLTAKERLTIEEAWIQLGLQGAPRRGLNKSPFREDRNPSFSIYGGGRRWKDFGTGEGGSVVDFIMKVTGSSVGEAIQTALRMAGVNNEIPPMPQPIYVPDSRPEPEPLVNRWDEVKAEWYEGVDYLNENEKILKKIADWRRWPVEWMEELVKFGFISCPKIRENGEERGIAFLVEKVSFEGDKSIASFGARPIGYHVRLKDGTWRYRPSKIPANPLILGSLLNKRLFVCEGQWDAITLAGAAGYFDSCWEEDYGKNNSCAVAIRGVSGYGLFLDILKQRNLVFDKPEVFLFRDNDKAGETWRDKFAPRLAELASVRLFRPAEGKDINEIHKANPLTLADVEQTLGGKS